MLFFRLILIGNSDLQPAAQKLMKTGVDEAWNNKFFLQCEENGAKCDYKIKVSLEFDAGGGFLQHPVTLHNKDKILEGDQAINTENWIGEDFGTYKVGDVAAHEVGHLLGNPDLYNNRGGPGVTFKREDFGATFHGDLKKYDKTFLANQSPSNLMQDQKKRGVTADQYFEIKKATEEWGRRASTGNVRSCKLIRVK
jgi:hypothetical protein